ncbi:MAG: hypothetical protein MHM6MM_001461 [Cercozoa sp. M6MM]
MRRQKGATELTISRAAFWSQPQFAHCPFRSRLQEVLTPAAEEEWDEIDFEEFIRLLAVFSDNTSLDRKIALQFALLDVDGDGAISRDDLCRSLTRVLRGTSLASDRKQLKAQVTEAVELTFAECAVVLWPQRCGILRGDDGIVRVQSIVDKGNDREGLKTKREQMALALRKVLYHFTVPYQVFLKSASVRDLRK